MIIGAFVYIADYTNDNFCCVVRKNDSDRFVLAEIESNSRNRDKKNEKCFIFIRDLKNNKNEKKNAEKMQ